MTHSDTKGGVEYSFQSEKLDRTLRGEIFEETHYEILSTNGSIRLKFKTQSELLQEFFKVLSLAHECVPEKVKKNDGTELVFY